MFASSKASHRMDRRRSIHPCKSNQIQPSSSSSLCSTRFKLPKEALGTTTRTRPNPSTMTLLLSFTRTATASLRSSSVFPKTVLYGCYSTTSRRLNPTTSPDDWEGPIPLNLEHYTEGWNIVDIAEFTKPGKYAVQTFNKISPQGLARFPEKFYTVEAAADAAGPAHAILLRSHKLQESEVDISVRAIARCGAGTNNIPVARMTELGIPVFNTPGANANAVKELIVCGMLLGSRRIVDGVNHMKKLGAEGTARERVEKDKAMFGGREVKGKTLAVIGLGHIGSATARDAFSLGMHVVGTSEKSCYDRICFFC